MASSSSAVSAKANRVGAGAADGDDFTSWTSWIFNSMLVASTSSAAWASEQRGGFAVMVYDTALTYCRGVVQGAQLVSHADRGLRLFAYAHGDRGGVAG